MRGCVKGRGRQNRPHRPRSQWRRRQAGSVISRRRDHAPRPQTVPAQGTNIPKPEQDAHAPVSHRDILTAHPYHSTSHEISPIPNFPSTATDLRYLVHPKGTSGVQRNPEGQPGPVTIPRLRPPHPSTRRMSPGNYTRHVSVTGTTPHHHPPPSPHPQLLTPHCGRSHNPNEGNEET